MLCFTLFKNFTGKSKKKITKIISLIQPYISNNGTKACCLGFFFPV